MDGMVINEEEKKKVVPRTSAIRKTFCGTKTIHNAR